MSSETRDITSFCNPCHTDENKQGGCLATCTAAFCECAPFGTLSQWIETTSENPHPSTSMKWSILHVICSSSGMSSIMNLILYNSFYSRLSQLDPKYPGKTCCGCCGMLCCSTCAFVKMERLQADFDKNHPNCFGGKQINTMD